MESSIVGEGPLTLQEVSLVIENCSSFAILQRRWRLFAKSIGVNDAELPGLDRRINAETLHLKEVPQEILKIWKAIAGTTATLERLCEALVKCELKDIADALKIKFPPTTAGKLPKFTLQGKLYSLEGLFENHVPEQISNIFKTYSQSPAFTTTGQILIIKQEACPLEIPSMFYIPRTLSYRNKLDKNILRADTTKEHIFLVKGAGKPELARASQFKPIERSGNQLEKVTVRHILLECDDDFDKICKKTTKPVHMMKFKNRSFFHLKSFRGMEAIQGFMKDTNDCFGEDEIIRRIAKTNSPSFSIIADSPGMGKTVLLAKLSKQIKKNYPNAINLFIVLQELAQILHPFESAIEAISLYATSNELTKLILQEILSTRKYHFYLFLDGYDEVMQNKLDLIDSFLHQLTCHPHIKTIITTRAHLKPRLENISQKISYEIQPFDTSNQIDFLTKYWSCKHGAENGEMLQSFAEKCVQAFKLVVTPTEKDIAGIPLQCSMLAEVYAEQATRVSKLKALPDDVIKMTSFFEMYKSLLEINLTKVGDSQELRQKYRDAHVFDSIVVLFPHWLDRFKAMLSPREEVEEGMMYSIGLTERNPSSNTPRCLHRTYAENILAEFIVWNLDTNATCIEFLFSEIFGEFGTEKIERQYGRFGSLPTMYELRNPVIAYFVDMHLQDRMKSNCGIQHQILHANARNTKTEDVCIAANVCCCHSLENCFDLIRIIFEKINIKHNDNLQDKYFIHLLHLVIERTENVSLLKKVLNLTRMKFQVNLYWHVDSFYYFTDSLQILDCTPLHVAVYHGKYNMVIYLLGEYGQDVLSIKDLMHCCLHESAKNSEQIIEDKISIIESLIKINRIRHAEDFQDVQPILQKGAHIRLIKYMAQLGADINTYSERNGTILHTGGDKPTYADLVRWALSQGFNRINHVDGSGSSPLSSAIQRFGFFSDDILRLFVDAGADINAQNYEENSILLCAIKWSKDVNFVKNLLDLGANPTHKNKVGDNAAHAAVSHLEDPILILELLKLLQSRGFTGLHERNNDSISPVKYAIQLGITDEELLKYLVEAGADKDGNCVLFYALEYAKDGSRTCLTDKLLSIVKKVNCQNKAGQNAAHLVIKFHYTNPEHALELLQLLELHGFKGFNHKKLFRRTPLRLAKHLRVNDEKLIKFLKERDSLCSIQ